jgi:tetratricopeptide (TPR) repeat protein
VLALWGLGEVERFVGKYGQAREYYTQALSLARHLGDRPGEVLALRGLGEVERLVGEYGQARKYHIQSLTLARDLGYRRAEAEALRGLGHVASEPENATKPVNSGGRRLRSMKNSAFRSPRPFARRCASSTVDPSYPLQWIR